MAAEHTAQEPGSASTPLVKSLCEELAHHGVVLHAEGRNFCELSLPPFISAFSDVMDKLGNFETVLQVSDTDVIIRVFFSRDAGPSHDQFPVATSKPSKVNPCKGWHKQFLLIGAACAATWAATVYQA